MKERNFQMDDKSSNSRSIRLKLLFISFFKIGLFTFGGGYAMIPIIQREIVENHEWITNKEILDIFAIAESTPGPVAINAATFVGYKIGGVLGAIIATVAVSLPSFIIIYIISLFLSYIKDIALVNAAFKGIRIGVLVLIASAVAKLAKPLKMNAFNIIVCVVALLISIFFDIDSVFILLTAMVAGILYSIYLLKKSQNSGGDK